VNETATEKHDKIVCQIARNYEKFLSSFVLYNSALSSTGQSSYFVKSGISLSANTDDVPGHKTSLCLETPVGNGSLDIYIRHVLLKHEKEEKGILVDIVVEVKSYIKSITETIRQINKHKQSMRRCRPDLYIVASPDDRYIDILESQDILFYDASLCKDW